MVVDYGNGVEEFTMNNYKNMSFRFVETAKKHLEKSSSDEYKKIIDNSLIIILPILSKKDFLEYFKNKLGELYE